MANLILCNPRNAFWRPLTNDQSRVASGALRVHTHQMLLGISSCKLDRGATALDPQPTETNPTDVPVTYAPNPLFTDRSPIIILQSTSTPPKSPWHIRIKRLRHLVHPSRRDPCNGTSWSSYGPNHQAEGSSDQRHDLIRSIDSSHRQPNLGKFSQAQ